MHASEFEKSTLAQSKVIKLIETFTKMTLTDLKIAVKSVLASAGIPLTPGDLLRDFKAIEGYEFPYQELGFPDFPQCLKSLIMSDSVKVHYDERGVQVVIAVLSEKSNHLNHLSSLTLNENEPAVYRPYAKMNHNEIPARIEPSKTPLRSGPAVVDEKLFNSNQNSYQQNFINLSSVFRDLAQPIKDSLCISEGKGFFLPSHAYGNFLKQLNELLFAIESMISSIRYLVSDQNSFFKCCSFSLDKSINVLKRSFWFLHLVQTVEEEIKPPIFLNGVDIIEHAVSNIDEMIQLFSSEEIVLSRKKELLSCIARFYDNCLQILLFRTHIGKKEDSSSLVLQPIVGKTLDCISTANDLVSPVNFITAKNNTNCNFISNASSFFKPSKLDEVSPSWAVSSKNLSSSSVLTPLSFDECNASSDCEYQKNFEQTYENVEKEINNFELVDIKDDLQLDSFLNSTSKESNVIKLVTEDNKSPSSLLLNVNYRNGKISDIEDSKTTSKSQNPLPSENDVPKLFMECNKPTTSVLSGKNISNFSTTTHKKRFDQICDNIKDEINDFQLVSSEILKCMVCNITVKASQVEKHIETEEHKLKKNPSRKESPSMSQRFVNIFSGINVTEWPSCRVLLQEMVVPDSSKFTGNAPKDAYDEFLNQMQSQIFFFQINTDEKGTGFTLTCNLCNKAVNEGRAHVKSREHLIKMMESYTDEENRMFLDSSYQIPCSLCNVPLYQNECLWLGHFQSELHNLRLQEFHAASKNLEKLHPDSFIVGECFSTNVKIKDQAIKSLATTNPCKDAVDVQTAGPSSVSRKDCESKPIGTKEAHLRFVDFDINSGS